MFYNFAISCVNQCFFLFRKKHAESFMPRFVAVFGAAKKQAFSQSLS